MFLTGPQVVREASARTCRRGALGGPGVHERNGVCHFVVGDDADAVALVARAARLPRSTRGARARRQRRAAGTAADPGARAPRDRAQRLRHARRGRAASSTAARFLEVSPRWARNLVVGFARLDGRPVGIVANQPRYLGGVLDVEASQKGARFVATCDALRRAAGRARRHARLHARLRQESAGMIRHGAELVRAFAAATVPRFTVVLRKAYGGAYITMNSKELGADLVLAWPGAEIGDHGAARRGGDHPPPRARRGRRARRARRALADEYAAGNIAVERALELGLVDAVDPRRATRRRSRRRSARGLSPRDRGGRPRPRTGAGGTGRAGGRSAPRRRAPRPPAARPRPRARHHPQAVARVVGVVGAGVVLDV